MKICGGIMMQQFLETGEFVTTHGILGELKLYPWNDGPEFLLGFSKLYLSADPNKVVEIEKIRVAKNVNIVKLKGVNSIEEARAFIGKTVWIDRADVVLEPGQFFVQDLLGASVVDAQTEEFYGKVQNVLHPGNHDVYEILAEDGEVYLFPAVEEFIAERNIEKSIVLVRPIEGMFEKEEKKEKKTKKLRKKL